VSSEVETRSRFACRTSLDCARDERGDSQWPLATPRPEWPVALGSV
jgi:hypothetical protein